MKKKIFSAYDIIFIISVIVVFVYAVFVPPVHSVADQGDFERVMRPCGLDFPSDYSFYDYAVRFFNMKFTSVDLLLYVPRLLFLVPTTTFIFPTATARLICLPFGAFDMRILAGIMFLWYATVCFFIQRKFKIENKFLHYIFLLFFIVVFFNGVNLTILNSLYGQSVMLVSFATVVLFGLYMFENVHDAKNSVIIFFTVSSCLLLGSKLQCAVFTPFLIIAVLYVGFKSNKRNLCIVCSIVLLWHGVGGYVINGGQLNLDTQYNSVFYGILKDSPNPKQDLIDMGLDEDMAADSGKHAYLDKSEYKYPPRSDIMNEKFHSKMSNGKLIKFYITHPLRLVSVMETTAQNAFTNKINLGTFEKKYGYVPNTSSYRFDLWENIREHLPKTLFFIIPSYAIFLLIGIVMLKKKNRYAVPFIFVILMGLIQFPMPYIGNGAADISKQLFLFNISFDFGLTVLIYMLFKTVSKKLSKKISKNS